MSTWTPAPAARRSAMRSARLEFSQPCLPLRGPIERLPRGADGPAGIDGLEPQHHRSGVVDQVVVAADRVLERAGRRRAVPHRLERTEAQSFGPTVRVEPVVLIRL